MITTEAAARSVLKAIVAKRAKCSSALPPPFKPPNMEAYVRGGETIPLHLRRENKKRANLRRYSRSPQTPHGAWPRLMRASTAAAYTDEVSVETFRSRVGRYYSEPVTFPGRGDVWLRDDLDDDVDRLLNRVEKIRDAADVL